jgi:tRNA-2-methylthio-N6-dimethylallyladenosine synthase
MNVHDSEKLAGLMLEAGYSETDDDNIADIFIFNTCCVRDNAERRALGNISALKKIKKERPELIIAVVGCMTQQKAVSDDIYKRYRYIDVILGNNNKFEIVKAINHRISEQKRFYEWTDCAGSAEDTAIKRSGGTSAWIDIMYGCNNFCSYCIVPYVRGRERSRGKDEIMKEFQSCLDEGAREITLLGQNVNSYGLDLHTDYTFPDLLSDLASLPGKFRINYMTSHPKDFNRKVVDIIKNNPNISHYIHLPIQSGSNRVLELMNRRYTREKYMEIIDYIKSEIPDAGITTDIMVGFPGETEEDFLDTLDIVERVGYSNAFMFVYSPRSGTPAAEMEQLPERIKNDRIRRLIDLQRSITARQAEELVGSVQEVLAEDISPRFEGMLCGRSYNGRLVHFTSKEGNIGDFMNVIITDNKSAALIGSETE